MGPDSDPHNLPPIMDKHVNAVSSASQAPRIVPGRCRGLSTWKVPCAFPKSAYDLYSWGTIWRQR